MSGKEDSANAVSSSAALHGVISSVIEDMPMGVAVFDLDFRLLRWNVAWRSFFDLYSPNPELLVEGASLGSLVPGSEEWLAPLKPGLLEGRPLIQESVPIPREQHTTYWDISVSPIREAGRITGFVEVALDATRRVSAWEDLEQRVAERTAELNRRRKVATGLRDILGILNSSRPHAEVLDYIVRQAKTLLGSDAVSVYERNEDSSETILFASSHGMEDDPIKDVQLPTARGIVAETLMRGKPLVLADTVVLKSRETDGFLSADDVERVYAVFSRFRGLLAVPIMLEGRPWGALAMYYTEAQEFTEEDVALASDLAHHVALALENAALRRHCEEAAAMAERERLARDLHDAVTQTLFSATLIADVLPQLWSLDRREGQRRLEQLRQLTRGASAEMRAMLLELRPDALVNANLEEVLRQLVDSACSSGLDASLTFDGVPRRLPQDVHVAVYRVVQEGLNNVTKHANARTAQVKVAYRPTMVHVAVEDDGLGLPKNPDSLGSNHMGLHVMRERISGLGGRFRIATQCTGGVRLSVTLPAADMEDQP